MYKKNHSYVLRAAALGLLFATAAYLAGCTQRGGTNTIVCINDEHSHYSKAVSQMLPSFAVTTEKKPIYEIIETCTAAEAFDAQAIPSLMAGVVGYWYPQYLATVVIAIDRDRTGVNITSWGDLPGASQEVGISTAEVDIEMLAAAVAYGLEGESFSQGGAMELLASLQKAGLLIRDSFKPPIMICYDYQAAAQIKAGRNLEVVVPSDGTLTYEKGLMSNKELSFSGDSGAMLLDAGFRLPDGRCDGALYPAAEAYESAARVTDFAHLNTVVQDSLRLLRRSVIHSRMYSSTDGREHQIFALASMIIVLAWTATFIHRAMQKSARRAMILAGILLIGWIMARLIKYQLPPETTLNRYLWFSTYLPQLSLPLVILWIAWAIDNRESLPPKWMRGLAALHAALLAFVMTNDLHNLVFRVNLASPNWASEYSYGIVYYIVMPACFCPLIIAIGLMLYKGFITASKGRRGLRTKGIVFPLALLALLAAYAIGYAARFPLAWESDFTMTVGLFALMMIEAMIRSGMIPTNVKYAELFRSSSLGMRIIDSAGRTVWSSAPAAPYSAEMFKAILASNLLSAQPDQNILTFVSKITGGHMLWQEDISELNRIHRETEEANGKLEAANMVLAQEESLKRVFAEESNRATLMTQLEAEIVGYTIKLSSMIEQLESMVDQHIEAVRITMLLCYIKRRCSLFFRERETAMLPPDELTVYYDEIVEIAGYCDVKIIVISVLNSGVSVRRATVMYDFFYHFINWATMLGDMRILVHLSGGSGGNGSGSGGGDIVMRLMSGGAAASYRLGKELERDIAAAGGTFATKILDDDTLGLSLSFNAGGDNNG